MKIVFWIYVPFTVRNAITDAKAEKQNLNKQISSMGDYLELRPEYDKNKIAITKHDKIISEVSM